VGSLLDTSVLVETERSGVLPHLSEEDDIAISAVTAAELLHGVHRAKTPEQRARREAFVTTVLSVVEVLPFDLDTARVHARIWAELAAAGTKIGDLDMMIAATALAGGWTVITRNERDFARVPGLSVIAVR
jgi:predicted nucleic acid-binding protein